MARSSPSVQRVVAVLNLFADHPDQAFTLTDVVKTLKLSRATCHGLLAGLVEAGYLYRATDKSYVLGAALLHVGEMAKAHFSPLKVAQPEMRALADEFDVVCAAAFRERHEVVVRERATAVSHLGYATPRGARLPLFPQLAAPFFARSSQAEIKAWAEYCEPPCTEAQLDALLKGVEFTRKHGYQAFVTRPGGGVDPNRWFEDKVYSDIPLDPLFEINDKEHYQAMSLIAPVFDANRSVAFVLTLNGLQKRKCTGAELERIGARVREACDRITSFMSRPTNARHS